MHSSICQDISLFTALLESNSVALATYHGCDHLQSTEDRTFWSMMSWLMIWYGRVPRNAQSNALGFAEAWSPKDDIPKHCTIVMGSDRLVGIGVGINEEPPVSYSVSGVIYYICRKVQQPQEHPVRTFIFAVRSLHLNRTLVAFFAGRSLFWICVSTASEFLDCNYSTFKMSMEYLRLGASPMEDMMPRAAITPAMPPPEGEVSNFENPPEAAMNLHAKTDTVGYVCTAIALIVIILRIWTRSVIVKKGLGADDCEYSHFQLLV